jgi:hypothetical protein
MSIVHEHSFQYVNPTWNFDTRVMGLVEYLIQQQGRGVMVDRRMTHELTLQYVFRTGAILDRNYNMYGLSAS